jgi:HEAT repeat protein
VRFLAAFAILVQLALPALGKPPAPAPRAAKVSRAVVEARLRGSDGKKATTDWRALGAGVDDALIEVGGDTKTEIAIRARAVAALATLGTSNARRFLDKTILAKGEATEPDDKLILRKAAVALGWMGGRETPARLAPLLDHPDPEVRLDAAIGLGLTRLANAADPLRKRLATESDARVKTQLSRQLQVIEMANPAPPPARDPTRDSLPPTVRP